MGQAKARGTAEVREKEGIEKRKAAEAARKQADIDAEKRMTPEQLERRKNAKLFLSQMMALTAGNTDLNILH